MGEELTADRVIELANSMRASFASREPAINECRRYGYPLWSPTPKTGEAGTTFIPHKDSTPACYAWRAAMFLYSNTVGIGQTFFRIDTDDKLREELRPDSSEMKKVTGITLPLMREFADTNMTKVFSMAFHDMTVLGTAVGTVDFNKDLMRLEFTSFQIGNGCYMLTNSSGRADHFCRYYTLTARQLFDLYGNGKGNLAPDVLQKLENASTANDPIEMCWVVYPRLNYGVDCLSKSKENPKVAKEKKRWASVVVDVTHKVLCSVGGYDQFPFAVCPWIPVPGSAYGIGPTEMSLRDIKRLVRLSFLHEEALEKQVNPPLIIPYGWEDFDRSPGAYNYIEANGQVRDAYAVLEPPPQLPDIRDQQQRAMMNIRANCLLDAFETFDEMTKTMSAMEAKARLGQGVRAIASIATNIHTEFLSPLIQRSLDLLIENGVLQVELPPTVERERLRVKYVSVLSSMILDAETGKIRDFFTETANLQQTRAAFGAEFDAYFDIDRAISHLADFYAIPQDIVRTKADKERELKRLREEVSAAQEQEQETAMLSKMNPQARSAPGSFAARKGY